MLMLFLFGYCCKGQKMISGEFTVPLYEVGIVPNQRAKKEFIGLVNTTGQMRYRAFWGRNHGGDPYLIDTVFVTKSLSDDYLFSDLVFASLPSTVYPKGFCHVIDWGRTYAMPTSRYWRKVNLEFDFRYVDCYAKLIVQDLGIHQARLINRLGSFPKDHFFERPVHVLYILEFLELKGACESLDSLGR